jgi:hypothetical protein
MTEYVKIYSGSFIIIQRITSELNEVGINPIVKDEGESSRLAGFGAAVPGFQKLFVHESEVDKATPIVEAIQTELA